MDLETEREQSLKKKETFLAQFMTNPAYQDAVKILNLINEEDQLKQQPRNPRPTKKRNRDASFRFSGNIPLQRRSSSRLQNKKPDYTYLDLPEEGNVDKSFHRGQDESCTDLEEIVHEAKKRRSSSRCNPPPELDVKDVTDDIIKKICTKGKKEYSDLGSTCHQCRQKTLDVKTVCRSGKCRGLRGQFCGICVIQRYGEDPVQALKDPKWECYVCRGTCNCSFCRQYEGKRPTGQLFNLAKTKGFKSVADFLLNLQGRGDYAEKEYLNDLFGFHENTGLMVNNEIVDFEPQYLCLEVQKLLMECEISLKKQAKDFIKKYNVIEYQKNFATTSDGTKVPHKQALLEMVTSFKV